MDAASAADALMRLYPRIYFACHLRHVRDPSTGRPLSARLASILDHLDPIDMTFVKHLAAHMGVTASTMSLALDRLERDGYVRRVADKADARRVGVVLTRAGQRIRERSSVLDPELVRALVGSLENSQRGEAIGGLETLAAAADQLMLRRAEGGRSWKGEEQPGDGRGVKPRRARREEPGG